MQNFFCSWSGGKDSCYAFMQAVKNMKPLVLLNMMNENDKVSRSHAIPKEILHKQAEMLQLPIITKPASWEEYENTFIQALTEIKQEYNIDAGIFGDIDLQPHREWEEKVCKAVAIEAILPLWKYNRKELVYAMIDDGIEAYIVSCNEMMGDSFLGKKITKALVSELEAIGVDACGENGEYHTLVVNCPLFAQPLTVDFRTKTHHKKYWFIEMSLT